MFGGRRMAADVWRPTNGGRRKAADIWRPTYGCQRMAANVWRPTYGVRRLFALDYPFLIFFNLFNCFFWSFALFYKLSYWAMLPPSQMVLFLLQGFPNFTHQFCLEKRPLVLGFRNARRQIYHFTIWRLFRWKPKSLTIKAETEPVLSPI